MARGNVEILAPGEMPAASAEETFERLRNARPEPLTSRMRVNHAMILNVINQPTDPVEAMRLLMEENHEDARGRDRKSVV